MRDIGKEIRDNLDAIENQYGVKILLAVESGSRSNMKFILMDLLDEGAITAADLDGFSDDLRDSLLTYIELRKNRVDQ